MKRWPTVPSCQYDMTGYVARGISSSSRLETICMVSCMVWLGSLPT